MPFPATRLRRNRKTPWSRAIMAENRLHPTDLIWPLFIHDTDGQTPVPSMPGVHRLDIAAAVAAARDAHHLAIPAIALFPHVPPEQKSPDGKEALNPDNLICRTIQAIKTAVPDIGLLCDVALDPYTTHGHDGLFDGHSVLNDETLDILAQQALLQARAGCDMVAPSDMMDGRIGKIRQTLEDAGLIHTQIIAYAAKYASAFYGPFRDAVGSGAALKGDKRGYQMDPANSDEALREAAMDMDEGADMIIIKPGMPCLDIIHRVKTTLGVPTIAYQVSGEYAMLLAASDAAREVGSLNRNDVIMESLIGFKRAGADAIISYFARDAARLLAETP